MRLGRRLIGRSLAVVALAFSVLGTGIVHASDEVLETCPVSSGNWTFSDLRGLSDEAIVAIECVAHHAVGRGTSDTAFSPLEPVARWQMALFLQRTARAIRVSLPLVTASPFTDVGDLSPETRLAINQLAAVGIVNGTAPTTFDPMSSVPRWQMAVFLERLLGRAGISSSSGAVRFADVAGVTPEAVEAISSLASIGIVRGTGDGLYEPWSPVSRWETAVFLSRVLEAGDADPVVLEIELSRSSATYVGGVIATITASKPNGDPFPGVLIDAFVADAIASDGSCRLDFDASVNGGDPATSEDCVIDIGDPRSNSDGEVTIGLAHAHVAETDSIYVWAGDLLEFFDAGAVRTWASTDLVWLAAPSELILTGPEAAALGGTASFGARLVGAGAGESVHFEVERNGMALFTHVAVTGSNGSVGWSYRGPADPSVDDDPPVVDAVTAFWDRNGNGSYDGPAEFRAVRTITWDDAP